MSPGLKRRANQNPKLGIACIHQPLAFSDSEIARARNVHALEALYAVPRLARFNAGSLVIPPRKIDSDWPKLGAFYRLLDHPRSCGSSVALRV
jgi:hypothetical protein